MKYTVIFHRTEEGISVSVPGLPRLLVWRRHRRRGDGEHAGCYSWILGRR